MAAADFTYGVSRGIFERFPTYRRGVVVASGLRNGPSVPELIALLRDAEAGVRAKLDPATIADHPTIKPWREAFRSFGAKPSDFRPSIEALARRAVRGDELPSVSALVDIGTIASLSHLLPVGAHALDDVERDIELRHATGAEVFIPFGTDEPEHPTPGEVILCEGDVVLTRRWVWRQANHTLVVASTTTIVVNVDVLDGRPPSDLESALTEVRTLLLQHCGGTGYQEVLDIEQPSIHVARSAIEPR